MPARGGSRSINCNLANLAIQISDYSLFLMYKRALRITLVVILFQMGMTVHLGLKRFVTGGVATLVLVSSPIFAHAEEPVITAKVNLGFKVAGSSSVVSKVQGVTIGVYGNESPLSSKVFLSLCAGENPWDVSYDLSQVSRILKDQRIDVGKFAKGGGQRQETWMDNVGKVRIRNVNVAENTVNNDQNNLRHDSAGVVSMKKGGGSFEFSISPKANPKMDEEQVVIGRVLGGLDVIEQINEVPTSREDALGTKSAFSSAGKSFDGRAKLAMPVGRPLRKVVITSCEISDKASLTSFLKF